jgi:hypothetical protein
MQGLSEFVKLDIYIKKEKKEKKRKISSIKVWNNLLCFWVKNKKIQVSIQLVHRQAL